MEKILNPWNWKHWINDSTSAFENSMTYKNFVCKKCMQWDERWNRRSKEKKHLFQIGFGMEYVMPFITMRLTKREKREKNIQRCYRRQGSATEFPYCFKLWAHLRSLWINRRFCNGRISVHFDWNDWNITQSMKLIQLSWMTYCMEILKKAFFFFWIDVGHPIFATQMHLTHEIHILNMDKIILTFARDDVSIYFAPINVA